MAANIRRFWPASRSWTRSGARDRPVRADPSVGPRARRRLAGDEPHVRGRIGSRADALAATGCARAGRRRGRAARSRHGPPRHRRAPTHLRSRAIRRRPRVRVRRGSLRSLRPGRRARRPDCSSARCGSRRSRATQPSSRSRTAPPRRSMPPARNSGSMPTTSHWAMPRYPSWPAHRWSCRSTRQARRRNPETTP